MSESLLVYGRPYIAMTNDHRRSHGLMPSERLCAHKRHSYSYGVQWASDMVPTSKYRHLYGESRANDHHPPSKETSKSGTVGFADGVKAVGR